MEGIFYSTYGENTYIILALTQEYIYSSVYTQWCNNSNNL